MRFILPGGLVGHVVWVVSYIIVYYSSQYCGLFEFQAVIVGSQNE